MATVTKSLENESILILTITDAMQEQDITQAYILSIAMAQEIDGPVYRVIDVRQAASSYHEVVSALQMIGRSLTGAAVDPEMEAAFVGQKSMQPFFAEANMSFFEDMGAALEYAQSHLSLPLPA